MIVNPVGYDLRDVQIPVPTPTLIAGQPTIVGPLSVPNSLSGEVVGLAWDATAKTMHIVIATPTP